MSMSLSLHQLALETYATTKRFPKEETFSLVDQTRRAAASVGTNLTEGAMRLGSEEYRQFVGIAGGSAGECLVSTAARQRPAIYFQ
jgi:four helix bundle protein